MMLTVLGIVLFAVGLLASIALHEVGHLLPAKRFGVKVTQYMVGFGPTMWSRRRGDTEYGLKWVPAGGYIRMIGMFPPKAGEDPTLLRASSTGPFRAMVDDARRVSMEEVTRGDEDRVFYKLPVHQKVVVMMGGPTMNLVLAVVLLGIALCVVGTPRYAPTTTVGQVSACLRATGTNGACAAGDAATPAKAAGLREGDTIVSFDGQPVTGWSALQADIRAHPAGPVPVGVERDGTRQTLQVDLARTQRPTSVDDPTPVEVGFMGFSPSSVAASRETLSVGQLPGQIGDMFTQTARAIVNVPARMVGVWQAAFSGAERDPNGPIGVVGVSRIGGEVAAAPVIPLYGKVSAFVGLLGSVNMALFVFNLVPLLPLDGGHVAGALYEGARRQLARLRHRADPGHVDVARMLPVAYTVAILLVGMSALLLYADVINPVRLSG